MTRPHIPVSLRRLVLARAEQCCEYCLLPSAWVSIPHHVDHIIPLKHGGATAEENLAYACFECNIGKGSDIAAFDPPTGQLVRLFNPRTDQWSAYFTMTRLLIEVHDQAKEEFLRELLASLPYVSIMPIDTKSNGVNGHDITDEEDDDNPFSEDPRRPQMEKEVAAFEEQHSTLVAQYLGEFIAMVQGQVIGHDLDQWALIRRVRSDYPDQVVLFRQVEESLPRDLVVHSVRFA